VGLSLNSQDKSQRVHFSEAPHVQPPILSVTVSLLTKIIPPNIYVSTPLILRDLRIRTKQPTPRHPIRLTNHHPFQLIRRLPFLNPLYQTFEYVCWVCTYAVKAVAEPRCLEEAVIGMDVWIQGGGYVVVLDCSFGGDDWIRLSGLVPTDYVI
jgi:hypothetical protein